jgi:hypothetical protein
VQGAVGADRHIDAEEIVIDRADQASDPQLRAPIRVGRAELALINQFRQEGRSLLLKQIGAGEAAIAADHHEIIDATLEQIARRDQSEPESCWGAWPRSVG